LLRLISIVRRRFARVLPAARTHYSSSRNVFVGFRSIYEIIRLQAREGLRRDRAPPQTDDGLLVVPVRREIVVLNRLSRDGKQTKRFPTRLLRQQIRIIRSTVPNVRVERDGRQRYVYARSVVKYRPRDEEYIGSRDASITTERVRWKFTYPQRKSVCSHVATELGRRRREIEISKRHVAQQRGVIQLSPARQPVFHARAAQIAFCRFGDDATGNTIHC